jgi:hypothetical protein
MKKIFFISLLVLTAGFFGCKMDSDVLATYKDGKITRGDFYKWLDNKHLAKESVIKSKSNQKDKLEKMALELITVAKAKSEGFEKTSEFLTANAVAVESVLMKRLYEKEIKEKSSFKEPAVKVKQILLRVKDYEINPKQKNKRVNLSKEDLEKRYNETIAKGKEIIEKLNKGEKFEELAKQYSEDFSKKNGGDIGFIIRDMMPPDFSAAAFALKKGEYTKEPVRTTRGVYIIKADDTEELTDKNIEKIIENKGQATRIKSEMSRNYAKSYIDGLMSASDVKYFEEKALSKNKSDILFKIGDKNYTVEDMNTRVEVRQRGAYAGSKQKITLTDDQKKNIAKNFFQFEILKRDALAKGIDKDPEYIKEMQMRTDSTIAREYTNKVLSADIKLTPAEIKEEYEKNKETRYSKMISKGNKRQKQPESFNNVKGQIEQYLTSIKKSEKRKNFLAQLLQEYNYKLDESKLAGKK